MAEETTVEKRTLWSKRINLVLTVVWLLMLPLSYKMHWLNSVTFIALASLYANMASHLAAWRSDENPDAERMQRIEDKLDQLLDKGSKT